MTWFRPPGFEAEDRLAFLHQIEPIARDRFQICRVRLQELDFLRLPREQRFLLVHLRLQFLDLGPALLQFFVGRKEETDDDEPDGDEEQDAQNTVQPLPDGGLAPRAEIAVASGVH